MSQRITESGGVSQRPAGICRELLAALTAAEGRRRRRKRDTTPDAIGIAVKRELLEQCWRAAGSAPSAGAVRAMALEVLGEWRLAAASPAFTVWLDRGAPSDDARPE